MSFPVFVSTANVPIIVGALTGLTIVSWLVMLGAHSAHEDQHALLIWGARHDDTVGFADGHHLRPRRPSA